MLVCLCSPRMPGGWPWRSLTQPQGFLCWFGVFSSIFLLSTLAPSFRLPVSCVIFDKSTLDRLPGLLLLACTYKQLLSVMECISQDWFFWSNSSLLFPSFFQMHGSSSFPLVAVGGAHRDPCTTDRSVSKPELDTHIHTALCNCLKPKKRVCGG